MFKNRYRVVGDAYLGYEAQVKFWWFPVYWFQLSRYGRGLGINTAVNVLSASELCRKHATKSAVYKVEV